MSGNNEAGEVVDVEKGRTSSAVTLYQVTEVSSATASISGSVDQVTLYDGDEVNLIPMPTSDPKGISAQPPLDTEMLTALKIPLTCQHGENLQPSDRYVCVSTITRYETTIF